MKENPVRSIIKTFSWRITATLVTVVISYILTKNHKIALSIGVAEVITKLIIYYLHERIWSKIDFGTNPSKNNKELN